MSNLEHLHNVMLLGWAALEEFVGEGYVFRLYFNIAIYFQPSFNLSFELLFQMESSKIVL